MEFVFQYFRNSCTKIAGMINDGCGTTSLGKLGTVNGFAIHSLFAYVQGAGKPYGKPLCGFHTISFNVNNVFPSSVWKRGFAVCADVREAAVPFLTVFKDCVIV